MKTGCGRRSSATSSCTAGHTWLHAAVAPPTSSLPSSPTSSSASRISSSSSQGRRRTARRRVTLSISPAVGPLSPHQSNCSFGVLNAHFISLLFSTCQNCVDKILEYNIGIGLAGLAREEPMLSTIDTWVNAGRLSGDETWPPVAVTAMAMCSFRPGACTGIAARGENGSSAALRKRAGTRMFGA